MPKILIVDDNPANRDMLARRIQQENKHYEYDFATNGQEAMAAMQNETYDIILLDIMMPLMNGYEVLQKMQDDPELSRIPVIVISAVDDMDSIVKCIQMGAEDYLPKPFNATLLRARIESSLEKARLRNTQVNHLIEVNEMKDQFVGTVSHDLRNPISIIRGYADLIRQGELSAEDEVRSAADKIVKNSNHMLALINDLLDIAKIEAGIAMQPTDTEFNAFVERCIGNYEMAANEKNISLIFDPLDEDVILQLDEDRFSQVVNNLVSNAIKYTPEDGEVAIAIVAEGDSIILEVADNGFGIPEKDIPHLFEKFFRVGSGKHRQVKGTGLGLSIVKAIIEAHDGSIQVDSQLDEGTTFKVRLPRS